MKTASGYLTVLVRRYEIK